LKQLNDGEVLMAGGIWFVDCVACCIGRNDINSVALFSGHFKGRQQLIMVVVSSMKPCLHSVCVCVDFRTWRRGLIACSVYKSCVTTANCGWDTGTKCRHFITYCLPGSWLW